MSTDWHTFREWLLHSGIAHPEEAWDEFDALARSSSHADDLAYITHAAEPLPHVMRLPILTGVAGLMTHLETSPDVEEACTHLGTAIGELLTELNFGRPGTAASALMLDLPGRQELVSWMIVVQAAQLLLLSTPRSEQITHIAALCNQGLRRLVSLLQSRLLQNHSYDRRAMNRFGYALTLYTDAVRRLNDELGVVIFAEPPPFGVGVNVP